MDKAGRSEEISAAETAARKARERLSAALGRANRASAKVRRLHARAQKERFEMLGRLLDAVMRGASPKVRDWACEKLLSQADEAAGVQVREWVKALPPVPESKESNAKDEAAGGSVTRPGNTER